MTETEKLKAVAERLGWEQIRALPAGGEMRVYGTPPGQDNTYPFRPEKYPAQLVECIEWLLQNDYSIDFGDKKYCLSKYYWTIDQEIRSDTLAEAAINAIAIGG